MNNPNTTSAPATLAEWQETGEDLLAELSRLLLLADKVARVHGPGHPEMVAFAATANTLVNTVAAQVARVSDGDRSMPTAEVVQITADLATLRQLSNAYTPWPGSCASVYLLMRGWATVSAVLIERLDHA